MGLTAKWRVKCISLAEAKDILAGCKRLEWENQRRECQYYQERFAPMHQPSRLSVNAAPFQPWAAVPTPRPAEMPSDPPEAGRRGSKDGLTPSRRSTTSSIGKIPSPMGGPYPQTSDNDVTSDGGLENPSFHRKGKRSCGSRVAEVVKALTALTPLNPLPVGEAGERRKMGFLVKSKSQGLGEKGVIRVRSLMPSGSGLGASPTTGTTMRTLT